MNIMNQDTNQDGDRTLFQQQMVVLLSVVLAFVGFLLASGRTKVPFNRQPPIIGLAPSTKCTVF